MEYNTDPHLMGALGRIAAALESIASSLKHKDERAVALDSFEETFDSAIRAIKVTGAAYVESDVRKAVAVHEYRKLGFSSPEALLLARSERWSSR